MLRPLLAKAVRLIAVARFETELWSKRLHLPTDRFVFIPNGADLPQPPHQTNTDRSLIVSIGRLERYKGHQRVIAALPYILQQRPDVRLWIAGAGPYEATLKQLAEQLQCRRSMLKFGPCPRPSEAAWPKNCLARRWSCS